MIERSSQFVKFLRAVLWLKEAPSSLSFYELYYDWKKLPVRYVFTSCIMIGRRAPLVKFLQAVLKNQHHVCHQYFSAALDWMWVFNFSLVDSIYIVDLFLAKKGVISIEKAFGRKSSPLSLSSKVLISHEDGAPWLFWQ